MKNHIILLIIFLSNGASAFERDSIYLINQSKTPQFFNYDNIFGNLESISLAPSEEKVVRFEKELLLINSNGNVPIRKKYLITKSDTLIINTTTLSYKNFDYDLEILNTVQEEYPTFELYHIKDSSFRRTVNENNIEQLKEILLNNYKAKDSIIRNNYTLNRDYQKKLIDHYRFEYLSASIDCIFIKLKDTASINKELFLLLPHFHNVTPIFTKNYRTSIKSLVAGYSLGHLGIDLDSIISQINQSLVFYSKDFALFYFTNIQRNKDQILFRETYQKTKPFITDNMYLRYLENIDQTLQLNESLNDVYINQTGTLSLDKIFKQNRGKYIILDFTASWCAPCMTSIPITEKLSKEYPEDIAFIYISIDNDINQWNKAVSDNNIPKTKAYYLVNGIHSSIAKKHQITSIPRYLVFDRQGQLIDQNAPSALDGGLERKIKMLKNN
ncbi:TlpA family protein disulfide reductase [Sphingobacterium faecale]|uniref:TlpA family protein disulfide reductase n=1 Tax=Sphingobacterium faecale TaxID=2803775 RepID=A0ABS1R032_9SPHI|nr:TlpA disulfide reductase family protein [Sphingobacterium faecale]MBL1408047.1 TlpA family protein disulfide reductase [Sphingobacterium faecale]